MIVRIDHGITTASVATAAGMRVVVLHDDQRALLLKALEQMGIDGSEQARRERREVIAVLRGPGSWR